MRAAQGSGSARLHMHRTESCLWSPSVPLLVKNKRVSMGSCSATFPWKRRRFEVQSDV